MEDIKDEPTIAAPEEDEEEVDEESLLDPKSAEAQRQVWLLKIPTEVYDVWKDAKATDCIATVRLYDAKGSGAQKVTLHLNEDYNYPEKVAREYSMTFTDTTSQGMLALAEPENAEERLSLRGLVTRRANAMPQTDSRYRSLLGERHNKHQQRTATQIVGEDETRKTRNVQHTFKVDAVVAAAAGKAPKDDKDKRFRMERSELERLIFKAFETHQFYFLKTLVNRTDQPQVWVKEVVKDLCVYHHKGKYKNMYELKPEYRNEFPAPQSEMAEGGEDDDDGGEDMDES